MTSPGPIRINVPTELTSDCSTRREVDDRLHEAFAEHIERYSHNVPSASLLFPDSVTWRKSGDEYRFRYVQKSRGLMPNTRMPLFMTLELCASDHSWELRGYSQDSVT